jgi:hypothetical protein
MKLVKKDLKTLPNKNDLHLQDITEIDEGCFEKYSHDLTINAPKL